MATNAGRVVKSSTGAVARLVTPIASQNTEEAHRRVLSSYKEMQRYAPIFWWDFNFTDMPLPVFRSLLKQQFLKNSHVGDIRVVDRLVGEFEMHMLNIRKGYYNSDHCRNVLLKENIELKPKDFLSKFLTQKE
uniref:NADH dehydrogenase [ubiquinone] 1 alpha subcomplex subunit 6 n=1 Tax=Acrobeloides nanus TaxID=290746 RepID=A0A914EA02_9BILA